MVREGDCLERPIADQEIYLQRMSKPLQEKLRVARYIPAQAERILDVGCADGTVTLALAELFPRRRFLGIDLDGGFIDRARKATAGRGVENAAFERAYLRELLPRPERYDAVIFVSVLHEFFTYGEGISSVLKALADAHELLRGGGEIVIRDMILEEYTKHTRFQTQAIATKVAADRSKHRLIADFVTLFGPLDSLYNLNHFLLKYMYEENWERESREHYVPVTFEQYQQLFGLLGMELQLRDSSLLPFLRGKWIADFGLTEDEVSGLRSTGFLAARKR
jgi:SAM-dependent methyltransferase